VRGKRIDVRHEEMQTHENNKERRRKLLLLWLY
jgi:hypothetical protein